MYLNKAYITFLKMMMKKVQRFGSMSKLAVDIAVLKHLKKASPAELGKFTKDRFSVMGPTFIKIGQFISTRSDIFGKEFTKELKGLQDDIVSFDFDTSNVSPRIKLSDKPIATASIGQVYKGKLDTGEIVAVKVKRPNIAENIDVDFDAFLTVVNIASYVSNQREVYELSTIVNEYYKLLKEEIDFVKEVSNMKTFRKLFSQTKFVKVPKPYSELCNNDIIVMEFVESTRIDNIREMDRVGLNRKKIAEKLVEVFLCQILDYGIIHIDPHPGNVGITKNGKIVFYDYGMIQRIGIDFKKDLKNILLAVYEKNVEYLCKLFTESEIVIVEKSKLPYLKNFVLVFLSYIDNLNVEEFKERYIDKIDPKEIPFTISSKFLLILRGITILEGVCKTLDGSFNYRENIEKFIDDGILDFEYIERKAIMDIDNMRTMPEKLTQNQIQLEIMEKNVQKIENRMDPKNAKTVMLFSLIFAFDLFENIYAKVGLAMATFVLLNK